MDTAATERIRRRIAAVDHMLADNELEHDGLEHELGALTVELESRPGEREDG
jgi:hypothetical protein